MNEPLTKEQIEALEGLAKWAAEPAETPKAPALGNDADLDDFLEMMEKGF